ncbi:hypothetical protein [Caldilinea sp.]|uniref:hypothetical protein n=1 Tax=Caldilinea sp. TaxID=2293560 RepID=UPI002BB3E4B8|nr:hypothetical protein [Caldilinea sp.]HRA64812.1 hypothetical protein [Caldilinea sp.]
MSRMIPSTAVFVIAVSLFAALLCLCVAPVLAQSTPDVPAAPEAPGSIAGVVTDAGGSAARQSPHSSVSFAQSEPESRENCEK